MKFLVTGSRVCFPSNTWFRLGCLCGISSYTVLRFFWVCRRWALGLLPAIFKDPVPPCIGHGWPVYRAWHTSLGSLLLSLILGVEPRLLYPTQARGGACLTPCQVQLAPDTWRVSVPPFRAYAAFSQYRPSALPWDGRRITAVASSFLGGAPGSWVAPFLSGSGHFGRVHRWISCPLRAVRTIAVCIYGAHRAGLAHALFVWVPGFGSSLSIPLPHFLALCLACLCDLRVSSQALCVC